MERPSSHSHDIEALADQPAAPTSTPATLQALPVDVLRSRDDYRYRLTVLCMLACTCHSLRLATISERTARTGTLRLRSGARYTTNPYKLQGITDHVDYMIRSMLAGVDDRRIWRAILVNHYLATGSFRFGTPYMQSGDEVSMYEDMRYFGAWDEFIWRLWHNAV